MSTRSSGHQQSRSATDLLLVLSAVFVAGDQLLHALVLAGVYVLARRLGGDLDHKRKDEVRG